MVVLRDVGDKADVRERLFEIESRYQAIFDNRLQFVSMTGSRILDNRATINGGGLFNDVNTFGATIVTGSCIDGNSRSSFYTLQSPQQIATSNWWGSPTGPNTPGAETTEGDWITGGFLTTPILGCTIDIYLPFLMK